MSTPSNWRPTQAEISLSALRENCKKLQTLIAPGALFCPMIKANAYGHGALRIAQELEGEGVRHLGVALIEEGEALRTAGIKTEILVFAAIASEHAARALLTARLTPVVGDFKSLEFLRQLAPAVLSLHLEFNTGMNRFGFEPHDVEKLAAIFAQNSHWNLAGLCTHFQTGGDITAADSRSQKQLERFVSVVQELKQPHALVHVLNSSAALMVGGQHAWGFRPGIALYGADALEPAERKLGLKPVLSWSTQIAVIHRIQPGESVSYNATWTAKRPSLIGVLPVGYGDGYARANSNKAHVLCRGLKAPVAGTVCMDSIMIDLTDIEAQTGSLAPKEPIVLLGAQGSAHITATEMGAWAETISYEVLTRIGERVPRVYNHS